MFELDDSEISSGVGLESLYTSDDQTILTSGRLQMIFLSNLISWKDICVRTSTKLCNPSGWYFIIHLLKISNPTICLTPDNISSFIKDIS